MCAIIRPRLKREAGFNMIKERCLKNSLKRLFFGCLFGIIGILGVTAFIPATSVYADEEPATSITEPVYMDEGEDIDEVTEEIEEETAKEPVKNAEGSSCKDSLGALGWLVCPATGKISEAIDWLYDKIESILIINPIEMKDGSPIYEVWKYMKGITNVVFIIFLLIVIYSQLTGIGISNYGIKKALPKLIVVAILVNLSALICTLAVDVSNIIGGSLRGVFTTIEEATLSTMTINGISHVSVAEMYSSLAGGAALAVGAGVVAFELGAIWMFIPVVLGAVVAVASGLITIALRQAVVALLVMISPLAIVAYMLPNTEKWFKKWKDLLTRMLVFYPMFSLLFGASSLAGWAIIASAKDGFGLLLGIAVQIFPLFFSWKLMQMSGTFLGTINAKMHSMAAKPLAANRAWADSHRQLSKQKHLASGKAYTPSLRLMQFMSNRKVAREEETAEHMNTVKTRGLAYNARRKYKNGVPTREAEEDYEAQLRNMQYQKDILRHKNNMNKGLGQLEAVKVNASKAQIDRLNKLDAETVKAADALKMEQARTEKIDYENAAGFKERMQDAMDAHMDAEHFGQDKYKRHDIKDRKAAEARYKTALDIMEGDPVNAQYTAAYAVHAYDTQAKIISTKFQKYFELTPPTRDVRYRLEEISKFTKRAEEGAEFDIKAADNIDAIVSGLRILNQRGDTDFVKEILDDVLNEKYGGLKLGTHASQSLANFLMFEVKDNDPYLRRFGKYINLETARMYDKNERQKETVDYSEYVKGYHIEPDGSKMYAKKDMVKLMEGTSLDGIERTALDNYDKSLRDAYTDENGNLDVEAYMKKREQVDRATAPQFISANMKFLSGSEQIVSAVKSKTGFAFKQDKNTGEYFMVPVWEDDAEKLFGKCETEEDRINMEKSKGKLKKFYREQTLGYLTAQTPAQILGLRSDFEKPLIEHLSDAYLYDDKGNEIKERVDRRRAMEDAVLSRYGTLDSKEAKAALLNMKRKDAGEVFREILYKKGKLSQIEKSKRSGAANNAKDWVREFLLLDTDSGLRTWMNERRQRDIASGIITDDTGGSDGEKKNELIKTVKKNKSSAAPGKKLDQREIREKMARKTQQQKKQDEEEQLRKMLEELKEQQKRESDAVLTPDQGSPSVYSASDVADFTNIVEDMWYNIRDEFDDEEEQYRGYFEASYDFIVRTLSEDSYVATAYKKYYQDNPDGDSYDLRNRLIELLETLLNG